MPTSRVSNVSNINNSGFTLVEVMAVVVVIGLALGAGLTLDFSNSPQQTETQARAFANAMHVAAQEAVLDGAVWGLDFFAAPEGATGYRWLRLEEGAWTPVQLPALASAEAMLANAELILSPGNTVLQPEARVALDTLAADIPFAPEILLQPTREVTPFTLRLGVDAERPMVIAADLLGRVRIDDDADAAR